MELNRVIKMVTGHTRVVPKRCSGLDKARRGCAGVWGGQRGGGGGGAELFTEVVKKKAYQKYRYAFSGKFVCI